MNERSKQLAGQALDKAVSYTWTTLNYEQIHELLACHAELIVRECVDEISSWRDAARINVEENNASLSAIHYNGYVHGCDDAIVAIKEHFGVNDD